MKKDIIIYYYYYYIILRKLLSKLKTILLGNKKFKSLIHSL